MTAMDEADGVKGSQINDVLHDEIVFVLNWTDTHKNTDFDCIQMWK